VSSSTDIEGGRAWPLAGVRVLDLSRVLSGPHCGRVLADLGADVVKVEAPDGDMSRSFGPFKGSLSGYFAQQNAGKRNVCIDFRHPGAGPLLACMVRHFDVLVENFRPGVMRALGLDADEALRINPRLVYASISGWGQTGPDSHRAAFATVIAAESGMAARSHRKHPPGDPQTDSFSYADLFSGWHCATAVLAALYHRAHTGSGQAIDVAMMSGALMVNEHVQAELNVPGEEVHVKELPYLLVDGRRVAIVADFAQPLWFERLNRAVGDRRFLDDERFVDETSREAHRDDLIAAVQRWIDTFDSYEALERALTAAQIASGLVRTVADIADSPWARHRKAIAEVPDWDGGTLRLANPPWIFSGLESRVRGAPSRRGADNARVLAEIGLGEHDIDVLVANGLLRAESAETGT
jgi:crotonobetainyl-CoA:carnitine CoA-transferase CaiB-like acyl-CoA transferase